MWHSARTLNMAINKNVAYQCVRMNWYYNAIYGLCSSYACELHTFTCESILPKVFYQSEHNKIISFVYTVEMCTSLHTFVPSDKSFLKIYSSNSDIINNIKFWSLDTEACFAKWSLDTEACFAQDSWFQNCCIAI